MLNISLNAFVHGDIIRLEIDMAKLSQIWWCSWDIRSRTITPTLVKTDSAVPDTPHRLHRRCLENTNCGPCVLEVLFILSMYRASMRALRSIWFLMVVVLDVCLMCSSYRPVSFFDASTPINLVLDGRCAGWFIPPGFYSNSFVFW